jgi:hypothetical protein
VSIESSDEESGSEDEINQTIVFSKAKRSPEIKSSLLLSMEKPRQPKTSKISQKLLEQFSIPKPHSIGSLSTMKATPTINILKRESSDYTAKESVIFDSNLAAKYFRFSKNCS